MQQVRVTLVRHQPKRPCSQPKIVEDRVLKPKRKPRAQKKEKAQQSYECDHCNDNFTTRSGIIGHLAWHASKQGKNYDNCSEDKIYRHSSSNASGMTYCQIKCDLLPECVWPINMKNMEFWTFFCASVLEITGFLTFTLHTGWFSLLPVPAYLMHAYTIKIWGFLWQKHLSGPKRIKSICTLDGHEPKTR